MPKNDSPVTVQVLHNEDCHVWKKALEITRDVLDKEDIQYNVVDELVETKEEARKKGFSGSPQVIINGQDVDPDAADITNYNTEGCRLYLYEGEVYDYPPEKLILDFLKRTRRNDEKV